MLCSARRNARLDVGRRGTIGLKGKLYRSREDRVIGGVCGGLARVLGINPGLLRLAFVLTAEVTAPVYMLLWIYFDEEPVEGPLQSGVERM